ncbi:MAG: GNAT family N-acetyltransferase [Candidatus Poribacteria bacterium]
MEIRNFREDDREYLLSIAPRAFSVWTRLALDKTLPREKNEEFFKREVALYMDYVNKGEQNISIIVAEKNDKVVGYIVVGIDKGRSQIYGFLWGHIISLAVDPDYHGQGIGSDLISAGLDWMRSKGVQYAEVLTDQNNIAAIRAYEKNNFRVIYSSIVLSQYL